MNSTKDNVNEAIIEANRVPILKTFKNIPRLLEDPIGLISSQFEKYGDIYKSFVGIEKIYLNILSTPIKLPDTFLSYNIYQTAQVFLILSVIS